MPIISQPIEPRQEFLDKLKWLMFSRVIIITFLLGSTVLVNLKERATYLEPYLVCLYTLIISTYFLTLLYIYLRNRVENLVLFAFIQIILDLVYVTAIVHITGGIESVFSFLYILSIINASILLYRRGGLIIASTSSILYGACLDLQYYGVIPTLTGSIPSVIYYKAGDIFYTIAMNITGFYATAFLSSFLAEQVRRSKEQLQEKVGDLIHLEALHDNIVQSISSGIFTLDPEGKITSFNRAAEEITGYSFSEVFKKRLSQVFPLQRGENEIATRSADCNSLPNRFEADFSRSNGTPLHLGFSSSVLRDKAGIVTGKIFIFQDLTPYRAMEEKIKRMDRLAAVGQLAAGIAHEIRNPLTSLSGSIQVLRDEIDLTDENRKLMDIALKETKRLNDLITNFLLFAQPERGEKKKINLASLIEETLDLFVHSPECRESIQISKSITPDIFVKGNAEHLKQVFWNILKNAAQAQPDGGFIEVVGQRVNTNGVPPPNRPDLRAKISIRDGGSGIPQDIQKKIFDPFFTTREYGSGLGLAISYRIVESHSGEISIRSKKGQGAEALIFLPLFLP